MVDAVLEVDQTLVGRVSDGAPSVARGLRDGTLVTADWYLALVMEGRVFGVNEGADTTPFDSDTGASTPAFDDNQPTFGLDIPANTVVMPLSIIYQLETHTGATPGFIEMFAGFAPTATTLGAGTSTVLTIVNMRTDGLFTSACTARGPYTGNASISPVATTGWGEFFRSGYPTEADAADNLGDLSEGESPAHYEWSAYKDGIPPIIVGPAVLVAYVSSTSDDGIVTGFFTATWAELPGSAVV